LGEEGKWVLDCCWQESLNVEREWFTYVIYAFPVTVSALLVTVEGESYVIVHASREEETVLKTRFPRTGEEKVGVQLSIFYPTDTES
jgi:hypothetical protein